MFQWSCQLTIKLTDEVGVHSLLYSLYMDRHLMCKGLHGNVHAHACIYVLVCLCLLTEGPSMPGSPCIPCFPWGPCVGQKKCINTGHELQIWWSTLTCARDHISHFSAPIPNILYLWLSPLFISFISLASWCTLAEAVPSVCYACVCFLCIDFLSSPVLSEREPEVVGSYSPAKPASPGYLMTGVTRSQL